ncbi:cbb3-type cytochrome c oxidase subunit I [Chryseobacterium sp. MFBS3-17]|uniref:cbb3-type cytochrome c oxidase subunit I n=1 Tax=Chryseobacterium sp. MFBS3-17 TaxID=2886689 RepID=UPI001D0DF888|nr:cbb3-type cytochrome c oxidase subunit I [Chryseobacterium sp. MFBS3-17]MCC2589957.1 cbb3-type cytochrome c oxidase subunit I [Chryseobacterium sp. MFBS3-17]
MMEPLVSRNPPANKFFLFALFLLGSTLIFGLTGALQYVVPGLLKAQLSFEKVRPLHVTSAVFWIIFSAMGAVYAYLPQRNGKRIFSVRLMNIQFYLFAATILVVLATYVLGIFGGREYWEFHPFLAIPVGLSWIFFMINVFRSVGSFRKLPVYMWMWMTGAAFFLFTFVESYLWLIPYFRSDIVHDMTIQWKSYGSMVGCWNQLIYGSSIYLMDKISGHEKYSYSRIGFALYFLGLFNLMFNWGHHIYTLPTPQFVQYISYGVSMTELILLGRIIWLWKSSLTTARKHYHLFSYRFLLAADVWILLTLVVAIMMSVPAINAYTHGTHITVAHTMGATIGINSFLILAFMFDLFPLKNRISASRFNFAFYAVNISLLVFWIALLTAGVLKAIWQMHHPDIPFAVMMSTLKPAFLIFLAGGVGVAAALGIIIRKIVRYHRAEEDFS